MGISEFRQSKQKLLSLENKYNLTNSSSKNSDPRAGFRFLRLAISHYKDSWKKKQNLIKSMHFALKALAFFEKSSANQRGNEIIACLQLLADANSGLGLYDEAIALLKRLLEMSKNCFEQFEFAAFTAHMQLGDVYVSKGKTQIALASYYSALEIQKRIMGKDPRIVETCVHIAQVHFKLLELEKAEELCKFSLKVLGQHFGSRSAQEIQVRRLMAEILVAKGEKEGVFENLAKMRKLISENGEATEIVLIDMYLGDAFLADNLYSEAEMAYQKALSALRKAHGGLSIHQPTLASVLISLAEVKCKAGRIGEAKKYSKDAIRIYSSCHEPDVAGLGFADAGAVFELMGEHQLAVSVFKKAVEILIKVSGLQFEAAIVEAQMGILLVTIGRYHEGYNVLRDAFRRLCNSLEKKKTWISAMVLNQVGVAAAGSNLVWDAAEIFEEARDLMMELYGPAHGDTISILSNLAGAYDAMGRSYEAIILLQRVTEVKEKRLGAPHPDVKEESERLAALLREIGLSRLRKSSDLQQPLTGSTRCYCKRKIYQAVTELANTC